MLKGPLVLVIMEDLTYKIWVARGGSFFDGEIEKSKLEVDQWPTAEARKTLGETLATLCPAYDPLVTYAADLDKSGPLCCRAWLFEWHPQSGNSGTAELWQIKNILKLLMVFGFESDANVLPGVEKPLISKPAPTFSSLERECPKIFDEWVGRLQWCSQMAV